MTPVAPTSTQAGLSFSLLLLLAVGAGLSVASIYYSQPMLGILAEDLQVSAAMIGLVPTLTQLGYALGILLLAPLSDRYDRRQVILTKTLLLMLSLLLCGISPDIYSLLASSLLMGLAATLAQDIVPAAATLSPDNQRGRAVGIVMTGLLLGILLSRVVSGVIGDYAGWRFMYFAAAAAVALLGLVTARYLPSFAVNIKLNYFALMASMVQLWRQYGQLRRSVYTQGLLALSFSAFWSTLAVMLQEYFQLSSTTAGAFGLAGAAGALFAPIAGRMADRRGAEGVIRLGCVLASLSFASLALGRTLPIEAHLLLLVAATIGLDLGIQTSQIANQATVYGLEPAARSRLNALLIGGMFVGMALGAGLGSLALTHWGWLGVIGVTTVSALLSLAVRYLPKR